jgi:hypothetical protein
LHFVGVDTVDEQRLHYLIEIAAGLREVRHRLRKLHHVDSSRGEAPRAPDHSERVVARFRKYPLFSQAEMSGGGGGAISGLPEIPIAFLKSG